MIHQNAGVCSSPIGVSVETPKPPRLCTRLAHGMTRGVKHFGLAVAAAGIITPLATGASYLAQLGGLIPEITRVSTFAMTHGTRPRIRRLPTIYFT